MWTRIRPGGARALARRGAARVDRRPTLHAVAGTAEFRRAGDAGRSALRETVRIRRMAGDPARAGRPRRRPPPRAASGTGPAAVRFPKMLLTNPKEDTSWQSPA
jgi:hypothetical protein